MFNISLSPEVEARLRQRARARGVTPEEYVQRVVEEAVSPPYSINGTPAAAAMGRLSEDEIARRRAAMDRWAGSIDASWPIDDSRESIYGGDEDRGE